MKRLLILLLCVVVAVILVLFTHSRDRERIAMPPENSFLLPGVAANMAKIRRVEITSGKQHVTLRAVKGSDTAWQVDERAGYPAQTGPLRQLIARLAESRHIERKTDDASRYVRLGLGTDDATHVRAFDAENQPLLDVYLGRVMEQMQASYVRLATETAVWRVSTVLKASADPQTWLAPELLSIVKERVARMEITHFEQHRPVETTILTRKDLDATEVDLAGVPAGRQRAGRDVFHSTLSAWDNLSVVDVLPAAQVAVPTSAQGALPQSDKSGPPVLKDVLVQTFDGLEVRVRFYDFGQHWVAISARYRPELVRIPPNQQHPTTEKVAKEYQKMQADTVTRVRAEAEAIQHRSSGWFFRIATDRERRLTKHSADFLTVQ